MFDDHVGDHRHHFAEDLAPLLNEQLVRLADSFRRGAVQEAEVVADIVGELGLQPCAQDVPAARGLRRVLDNHGGGDVAEDEVAVAVAEIQVAGADLGIDHQHGLGRTGGHEVGGRLDPECRRRAGDVHVERKAFDAQRLLHFDGHGRIGALHV